MRKVLKTRGGALHVHVPVVVEYDHVSSVHKGKAKVLGHDVGGEPLASRDHVLGRVLLDVGGEGLELLGHGPLDAQLVRNVDKALLNVGEKRGAVHVVLDVRVHQKEEVRDFVVPREALAHGRDHHKAAVGVCLDDGLDLAELVSGSDAGAPELADLDHVILS